MNKKNILTLVLLTLTILTILVACGGSKSKSKTNTSDVRIKQKIVFIQQYTNYSDSYVNRGFFIDNKGNKVTYDLSSEDKKYGEAEDLLTYLETMEYSEVEEYLTIENLIKYYNWLYKINLNYSLEVVYFGFDQGTDCLYGVQYDKGKNPIIILLDEKGDRNSKNKDKYASKIVKKLRK